MHTVSDPSDSVAQLVLSNSHIIDVLQCLHQLRPDLLSAQDSDGCTLTHTVAARGGMDVLRCLRRLVPQTLTVPNNLGRTPQMHALWRGNIAAVEYMIVSRCLQ